MGCSFFWKMLVKVIDISGGLKCRTLAIRNAFSQMLKLSGLENMALGVYIVSPAEILRYNRIHRQKAKPTDILSFRYPPTDCSEEFGEIIFCPKIIYKRCTGGRLNCPQVGFQSRLLRLFAHAVCHLAGHDHQTTHEYKNMRIFETRLLNLVRPIEFIRPRRNKFELMGVIPK